MEQMEELTASLDLPDLGQFTGTENYTNVMGVNITEGVRYIMACGYSWLVTDFIVIAKMHKKLKGQEFLSVKLVLDGTKGKMIVTDGDNNLLYQQEYEYTDAKQELHFFKIANVLLLVKEY